MSLLKKETICTDCDKHFILVIQEADRYELMSCPFCNMPLPEEEKTEAEEE
jgi:hypothetical protein